MSTYRDFKNVGSCDHCGYEDSFLVGQDSDGNYCDKCEQKEIEAERRPFTPQPKSEILWGLIAAIALATIFLAPWLAEGK